MSIFDWLLMTKPPGATVAIMLLALFMSFALTSVNRLFTNKEQMDVWRRDIAAWNAEFKEARKSGDKKRLAKAQKQQSRILKLQSKMSFQQIKVMAITFIPILLLWQLLGRFYGNHAVVFLPFLPLIGPLPLMYWYMLCSYLFYQFFQRFFGLGMGAPE